MPVAENKIIQHKVFDLSHSVLVALKDAIQRLIQIKEWADANGIATMASAWPKEPDGVTLVGTRVRYPDDLQQFNQLVLALKALRDNEPVTQRDYLAIINNLIARTIAREAWELEEVL